MTKWMTIFVLIFLFTSGSTSAQVFETYYGGNEDDGGRAVQQTQDGGYIVAGYTRSLGSGGDDLYWVKTDTSGVMMWWRVFGGSGDETGYSIEETQDGDYITAGYTSSSGAGGNDVLLIKTNASGGEIWSKTYGGSSSDVGYFAEATQDGGYIIVGTTNSFGAGGEDVYLIKTNSSGNSVWQKTYGDGGDDRGYQVHETQDGGYILAGYSNSWDAGSFDVYLIKTNSAGSLTWEKTFGGSNSDAGYSIQETQDGGYIIAGYSNSFGTSQIDVYLVKTDSTGAESWSRTYGGAIYDLGYSVQETQDGGYIIAGMTESFGAGDYDAYLIKTNSSGDVVWDMTYGGTGADRGYAVQETQDAGYIIAGVTDSFGAGGIDVYLIKTDSNGSVGIGTDEPGSPDLPRSLALSQNYPNPFNPLTTIAFDIPGSAAGKAHVTLDIYDVRGRRVRELVNSWVDPGNHHIVWDGRNDGGRSVSSGIYLYTIRTESEELTRKMTLLK